MELNLMESIHAFLTGSDTSIELANAIELQIDNEFPDDDFMQQTVEMLAMYRPEGGDFLFDTPAIKLRLVETTQYLEGIEE